MQALSTLMDTFSRYEKNDAGKSHHEHNHHRSHPQTGNQASQSLSTSFSYSSYQETSISSSSGSSRSFQSFSFSYNESSSSMRENGIKVLNHELGASLSAANTTEFQSKSAAEAPLKYEAIESEPPSPKEVADKILGVVINRLEQEAEQGASPERIGMLLEQAESGITKGFKQAENQIEQLGLSSDELSDDIDQSQKLINKGLNILQQAYIESDSEKANNPPTSTPTPTLTSTSNEPSARHTDNTQKNQVESSPLNEIPKREISQTAGYSQFSALSESTSIEIETQDGDIVSFSLSQLQASFKEGAFDSEASHYEGSYSSGQYAYSVEGDLDENEIKALNDLMVQIESLSEQFFGGDFQGAFESALSLGFDGAEIAGFSLNMNITQIQQVSTYEQVSNMGSSDHHQNTQFAPLSNFAHDLLETHKQAMEHFKNADQMITNLLGKMMEDRYSSEPSNTKEDLSPDSMESYINTLIENL